MSCQGILLYKLQLNHCAAHLHLINSQDYSISKIKCKLTTGHIVNEIGSGHAAAKSVHDADWTVVARSTNFERLTHVVDSLKRVQYYIFVPQLMLRTTILNEYELMIVDWSHQQQPITIETEERINHQPSNAIAAVVSSIERNSMNAKFLSKLI